MLFSGSKIVVFIFGDQQMIQFDWGMEKNKKATNRQCDLKGGWNGVMKADHS